MVKVKTAYTALLVASLLGIAACGDGDGDKGGTTTGAGKTGTTAKKSGEPILIKTHVAAPNARGETTGEVLSGSTIGGSAFCAGGTFIDAAREPGSQLQVRSFRCSGGNLTITFTLTPPDVEQRSDWKVVKGLGRLEGLSGGGRMKGVLDSTGEQARETFTGTVTR
jgi:hypothetical protein